MTQNYTPLSKATIRLHWLTGLSFLFVFIIGLSFDYIEKGPLKGQLMTWHKSIALFVLVFACIRAYWRIKEGSLPQIQPISKLQRITSTSVHHLLLLITLILPISGIMMSVGGGHGLSFFSLTLIEAGEKTAWLSQVGGFLHHKLPYIVLVLLALHLLGAFKHQWMDKDGTISRMLGR